MNFALRGAGYQRDCLGCHNFKKITAAPAGPGSPAEANSAESAVCQQLLEESLAEDIHIQCRGVQGQVRHLYRGVRTSSTLRGRTEPDW